ncbi:zinc-dependent alcohol dehydrogenase [Fredinandcohnia onubensis]|uniref:zinc-dependent alcohol dehydrogenase n=1 Tax=Fredinandcohnia onubensis TaxID=1571209 RepID=UPI000C0BF10C|nr:alcohol dehydrogenase catalytic domain-containing protein [Fredinandcohnia onubensis]
MEAAIIREVEGKKTIKIEELKRPHIEDHQVLVNVKAVGICGSDVHGFFDPDHKGRIPGLIMGHEAAGIVEEVGGNVVGLKKGDRVAIDPQKVCGTCYQCKRGWYTVCQNKSIIGSSLRGFLQGAMAEYVAVNASQVFVLPKHVSLEEGAMVEPVSNALHVMNRIKFDLGSTVVVLGAGTLGLCILQAAKLAGAGKVIITDKSEFRLKIAEELGADITINVTDLNPVSEVLDVTGSIGADVVVEAVGIEPTYRQAIEMVKRKGAVMFFGAVQKTVGIDLLPVLHKELQLIGCTGADWEAQTAVDLISSGKINVSPIITHKLPLQETRQGFDILTDENQNAVKVMIMP